MNLSDRHNARLWLTAAALAPALTVALTQLSGHSGPRAASASTAEQTPAMQTPPFHLPKPVLPLTERQREALAWFRSFSIEPTLASPLLAPERAAASPAQAAAAPDDDEPTLEPPNLRITGMMSGGGVHYASLNHRLSRVGDEVAPGWIVTAIDPGRQAVEIRHATGAVLELFVERPALGGER